ncbi:MAG: MFS transporter [Chloroflexales bacterium]|nr:MFS transporter [Chloroflexales bacterium]
MADTAVPPTTSNAVVNSKHLPLSTKLAFGAGDLAPAIATLIISFFQLFFLTTVAGLRPIAAGSILLLVRIWDAVNDPIIGWLSDRTRSRWGRRRPWILAGAVPFGIIFCLQWVVPPLDADGKFVYYLVMALLFSIAFTVVNVPYVALTPELTQDYDERTKLNSFRFAFSIGGSLMAGVLHQMIVGNVEDPQVGYLLAGLIWGGFCILPFIWCFLGTREPMHTKQNSEELSLPAQLQIVFSNRPYLFVIGIYLFSWLAVQMTASVLAFYVTFWLGSADQFSLDLLGISIERVEELIPLMLLAVQGSALIFLFVWSAVSQRVGKKVVYIIGMLFWIGVQSVLFFVQPDQVLLALLLGALAGVGVATAYLIPWSMMPDVIEYDEMRTGQRREGIFYGFMVFLQKVGLGLGLYLVSVALQWQGFIEQPKPGDVQPESALTAIRILIGPVPTIVLICGIILTAFYPITKQKHAEIRAQLAARQAASE